MVRYGRGVFEAHRKYIAYMECIVKHPNYSGMPNAIGADGRIHWQVSSGRSTSFYEFYEARRQWWIRKADSIGLPGRDDEQGRFTIAARKIHPTGYRPCRLCGESRNVGYFYLSHLGERAFRAIAPDSAIRKLMPISDALLSMSQEQLREVSTLFPDRQEFFQLWGVSSLAFEKSNHLRSRLLSPGYMGNPPDRLDGFHDYCSVSCRARKDPGRSEANMRSYVKDRRAFEYWADGDWNMAQDLYNRAGPGVCHVCGISLERVSPDHVGPLACGFAQVPMFEPLCGPHNSSKQRRLTPNDVRLLNEFERSSNMSVMSWYSRSFWDSQKDRTMSRADATSLSNRLRSRQDVYLRCLEILRLNGHYAFLRSLLRPEYALFSHEFLSLDPATFEFEGVESTREDTALRQSLARRSVRIALQSLADYFEKPPGRRRRARDLNSLVEQALERNLDGSLDGFQVPEDASWQRVHLLMHEDSPDEVLESAIEGVIWDEIPDHEEFGRLRTAVVRTIDELA